VLALSRPALLISLLAFPLPLCLFVSIQHRKPDTPLPQAHSASQSVNPDKFGLSGLLLHRQVQLGLLHLPLDLQARSNSLGAISRWEGTGDNEVSVG